MSLTKCISVLESVVRRVEAIQSRHLCIVTNVSSVKSKFNKICTTASSTGGVGFLEEGSTSSQYIQVRFAGHSKWQNIKNIKMSKDVQKSHIRAKLAYAMRVAIRDGGSADPKVNKKLADAIETARNNQVPMENIQKVLAEDKDKPGKELKVVSFAAKGPAQCILIIETETDNVTKTRQELTAIAKKRQFVVGDLATVLYQFHHTGIILCSDFRGKPTSEHHLEEGIVNAIEVGADDVKLLTDVHEYGTVLEFTTDPAPNVFYPVISGLERLGYKICSSELEYIALSTVELSDAHLEVVSLVCEKLIAHPNVIRLFDNIA